MQQRIESVLAWVIALTVYAVMVTILFVSTLLRGVKWTGFCLLALMALGLYVLFCPEREME
jgi:hypothetical protein